MHKSTCTIYTHTHSSLHTYACTRAYACTHTYEYTYACTCLYTHIPTFIYTHTQRSMIRLLCRPRTSPNLGQEAEKRLSEPRGCHHEKQQPHVQPPSPRRWETGMRQTSVLTASGTHRLGHPLGSPVWPPLLSCGGTGACAFSCLHPPLGAERAERAPPGEGLLTGVTLSPLEHRLQPGICSRAKPFPARMLKKGLQRNAQSPGQGTSKVAQASVTVLQVAEMPESCWGMEILLGIL